MNGEKIKEALQKRREEIVAQYGSMEAYKEASGISQVGCNTGE